jgi:hypothetical protein
VQDVHSKFTEDSQFRKDVIRGDRHTDVHDVYVKGKDKAVPVF